MKQSAWRAALNQSRQTLALGLRAALVALKVLIALLTLPAKQSRQLTSLVVLAMRSAKSGFTPKLTFSELGEDILISELESRKGFYVDVGAHHPFRFSVTARLSEAGWEGACFDVVSEMPEIILRYRPRAFAARQLIGEEGVVDFFRFEEELMNTASPEFLETITAGGFGQPVTESLPRVPLHQALLNLGIAPRRIDFINIDVEGSDFEVLSTHDFDQFPLDIILIELLPVDHSGSLLEPVPPKSWEKAAKFLEQRDYVLTHFLHRSALFVSPNARRSR